jgi:hypothetical protein
MTTGSSAVATASTEQVQAARQALDAWVREVVDLAFRSASGAPFWLDYAAKLGWDPRKEIQTYADLQRLGEFQDEWLRGGPVQRWVPKGLAGETGLRLRDRRHDGCPEDADRLQRFPSRLRDLQRNAAR